MSEAEYHKELPFGKIKEEDIDKDSDYGSLEYAEKQFKGGRLSWKGEGFLDQEEDCFELWIVYMGYAEGPEISKKWAKRILGLAGNQWDYAG